MTTTAPDRLDASEYLSAIVQEYFRDGSCDVRLVVSEVPREQWSDIDATVRRRYPEGDVKIEQVCVGVYVEFVCRASVEAA
jgi:hypothetical protein